MFTEEIRQLLASRIALEINDDASIERYWKMEVDLFKKDIKQTVNYFDNDCTIEEFDWFSEIFESLAECTQSKEIVDSLFRFILNHPECVNMPGVYEHCLYAEGAIADDDWECPLKQNTEKLISNCFE